MKVTVICVYNNENELNTKIGQSLSQQDGEFEFIAIDNRNNKFESAASALNYGVKISKGDVLIFTHQDIFLKESDAIKEFSVAIDSLPVGSIIGTQGVRDKSKIYYDNLTAGEILDEKNINKYDKENIEVSCVDEGFFGMKKETWINHKFDEKLCDNWHLYSVEMCLNARKNGNKVYVYPIQIHHYSYGHISLGYMKNLKRLCKVYRKDFKYIWTTCYKVRTNAVYINILLFLWIMNRKVRGTLN